jgi:crotonobetaine/carnitine-CoA ligase
MTKADDTTPFAVLRRAESEPERPFVTDAGGGTSSYAQAWQEARRWAGALQSIGVTRDDNVATMLPTSRASMNCWFGLSLLRARDTGINPAYVGRMLAYVVDNSDARVMVLDPQHLAALDAVQREVPKLRAAVVTGATDVERLGHIEVLGADALVDAATPTDGLGPGQRHDLACIVYTSGTTGPAKGVLMPWGLLGASDPCWRDLDETDVFYSTYSPHHSTGRVPLVWMAPRGGRVVLRSAFRTEDFWPDVNRYGCTVTQMVSTIMTWLLDRPPDPADAASPLRNVVAAPLTNRLAEFKERFGLRVRTAYGMTEIGMAISSGPDTDGSEGSGRATEGFELRLVDDNDYEVPVGEIGELVVRTTEPWRLMAGYHGRPEATADAWRNGWFHTGDAMRMDDRGCFTFVDRIKDAIRRRGENVSSFEVEQLVLGHPDVAECAAIGVPAEDGEQEIKVAVVLRPGASLEPEALVDHLVPRMPAFMIPRYVEILDDLPKTDATLRVRKQVLRDAALTPTTWDRRAHSPAGRKE